MITNLPTGSQFDSLNSRLKSLAEEFLDDLRPEDENSLIEGKTVLNGESRVDQNRFFLLTEGNVPSMIGGQILFHYQAGEIIGLESASGLGLPECRLEFAVRANIYDKERVFKKIRKDAERFATLMEYLAVQSAMFQTMLSYSLLGSRRPNFQMRIFNPGEFIIRQGDTDTDVYSLLVGHADVLVDGKKLGEIRENEIFGEMSRLTGEPRSATVRADEKCEVMVFGGEDFSRMAETNPGALMDMAKHLSERLATMNKEISGKQP